MNTDSQKQLLDNPIQHHLTGDTLQAASDILAVLSCAMHEAVASGSEPVGNGLVLILRWIKAALEHEIAKEVTEITPLKAEDTREVQNDHE